MTMLALAETALVALNRLLPAPALPGDADPLEYARWEHETSGSLLRMWDLAGPLSRGRALDLGCGLGGKTARLREHCAEAVTWTALDIDLEHLRGARAWFDHRRVEGVELIAGDAGALPFADAAFDRIVSADALEHLPHPRRTLRELRRCIRDDGKVVLLFNPWASPRGSHLADLVRLPWCQLLFDRPTLERLALRIAEDRARRAATPEEAKRHRDFGISLAEHFREHLHPTSIADLRRWLREDQTFAIERELRFGPGPIGTARWIQSRWCEEWMSATYGAVLAPLTA